METMYDYITPGILGVISTDAFDSGMRDFMQDCGIYSITSNEVNASRYDVFVDGVTEGLSHECPIALLFWDPDNGGMDDPDFAFHWVTMTKYYKDNNTQIEYFACSSWGERYSLPLYDYWWSYWIEGGIYYW